MLETLYELKAKYEKELLVAEAKVSVVNDLIAKEQEKVAESLKTEEQTAVEPTLIDGDSY